MKTPVFLRIHERGALVAVKQFTGDQISIGRQAEVDLDLVDVSVSNIHAMIQDRGGKYFVCDLGSEAGTFLNSNKILDAELQNGDQLQIGVYSIEFYIGIPKPKTAPNTSSPSIAPVVAPVASPAPAPIVVANPVVANPVVATPVQTTVTELKNTNSTTESVQAPVASQPVATPNPVVQEPVAAVAPASLPTYIPSTVEMTSSGPQVPSIDYSKTFQQSFSAKQNTNAKAHNNNTFAPPGKYKNVEDFITPSKGSIVEVLVGWGDRIINTYHCHKKSVVSIGSHPKNDIILPIIGNSSISQPLLKHDGGVTEIYIAPGLRGKLFTAKESISFEDLQQKNRLFRQDNFQVLRLDQGEMLRLDFGDGLSVYVRYVGHTPKAMMLPFLGLSSSELSAILVAGMIMLFMYYVMPTKKVEEEIPPEEIKVTKFVFEKKFTPPPVPVQLPKQEAPVIPPPPKPIKKVEAKDKPKETKTEATKVAGDPGKIGELAPNNVKKETDKIATSRQQKKENTLIKVGQGKPGGSAGKPAPGAGGGVQSKNVNNMGLLSAFGGGGLQQRLAKTSQGVGAIQGSADAATGGGGGGGGGGGVGEVTNTGLTEVSKGGNGTATFGLAGINTKGNGAGLAGTGTGSLGTREKSTISLGDDEAEFLGSIDKEAVRRVVRNNRRQLQACYENELSRSPDLHGKIIVQWEIGAGGVVTDAKIKSSTMNNSSVENCITSRLRAWRFPEPPANTAAVVNFPFVFAAK